jgi:hypothetical protein
MNTLLSDTLWETLTQLSNVSSSKRAAVAYVTNDEYVPFRDGDVLVMDASDSAITNGVTDARVLQRSFERGAALFSCPTLHSKVIVFDGATTVGSANLSWSSANVLLEASWLSDDQEAADQALAFIDSLTQRSTRIDEEFLRRILSLEVRPRPGTDYRGPRSYRRHRPHPTLLYFQEILPGDVRKYHAASADAPTGGGARDLRISPAGVFEPLLRQMFPTEINQLGVTQGEIIWTNPDGEDESTAIQLWAPTSARPNELRIGRFYDIGGWSIDDEQYEEERAEGLHWYFILEMGAAGSVTARLLQEQHIGLEDPLVAQHIATQTANKPAGQAARGAVDLQTRTTFGN